MDDLQTQIARNVRIAEQQNQSFRLPIGDVMTDGPLVANGGGGGGGGAPAPSALPELKEVRAGDLIRAEYWNALIAHINAIEEALTALGQAQPAPQPPGGKPPIYERKPSDYITAQGAAGELQRKILTMAAEDPQIREKMFSDPEVQKSVLTNYVAQAYALEAAPVEESKLASTAKTEAVKDPAIATGKASTVEAVKASKPADKPAATRRIATRRTG